MQGASAVALKGDVLCGQEFLHMKAEACGTWRRCGLEAASHSEPLLQPASFWTRNWAPLASAFWLLLFFCPCWTASSHQYFSRLWAPRCSAIVSRNPSIAST